MKEIKVEELFELSEVESIGFIEETDGFIINVMDQDYPFGKSHKLALFSDLSNLGTVNKMLAIFDYKIVKPLIDFTKPLDEELKRLDDKTKIENNNRYRFHYSVHSEKFMLEKECNVFANKFIGLVYLYDYRKCLEILEFLNNHKEEALKAMEL